MLTKSYIGGNVIWVSETQYLILKDQWVMSETSPRVDHSKSSDANTAEGGTSPQTELWKRGLSQAKLAVQQHWWGLWGEL